MLTEAPAAESSHHKCLIYEGHPARQLPVVVPLLLDGLRKNWRCLYVGSPELVSMAETALQDKGVDTRRESNRGALFLSSDRSHLVGGKFQPEKMIEGLVTLIDGATKEGFEGLFATGDMKWELGAADNFDRLLEYEALLELVFREKPLRGVCQYHRDIVPARAVRDALVTHRSVYVNETFNRDNWFYMPPEMVLEANSASAQSRQSEWMCQQIIRVLDAEHSRNKALTALEESEAVQRRLAEQLAEINRDLEQRVKERTAELEVANSHLEAFSNSVSHDLRAPLRSIVAFSEIVADECGEAVGKEGKENLERVVANAHRMEDLIEGLLKLGRVLKGDLNRILFDQSVMVAEIVQEIRRTDPARSAQFVIADAMTVVGDPVLLRAVWTNLLGNAWKFTAKRAEAWIEVGTASKEASQTTFFVADNGAGFDMKSAENLFGTFQRLHTQDDFPGTGVGLATVQRIIRRHGGKIWAEASPGKGATFFFTLPNENSRIDT